MELSVSMIKAYIECPARADETYRTKRYKPESTDALSLGALLDAIVTKGFPASADSSPNVGLLKNALASSYGDGTEHVQNLLTTKNLYTAGAKRVIAGATRLLSDPTVQRLLDGAEFQKRVTFKYLGNPMRGDLDILTREIDGFRYILDLKKPANVDGVWTDLKMLDGNYFTSARNVKLPWYDAWDYWIQLTMYKHAVVSTGLVSDPNKLRVGLLYATSEEPANIGMVTIDPDFQLLQQVVEPIIRLVNSREAGEKEVALPRCGLCPWCRAHSHVTLPLLDEKPISRYVFPGA